jgi:hypothetical protein
VFKRARKHVKVEHRAASGAVGAASVTVVARGVAGIRSESVCNWLSSQVLSIKQVTLKGVLLPALCGASATREGH